MHAAGDGARGWRTSPGHWRMPKQSIAGADPKGAARLDRCVSITIWGNLLVLGEFGHPALAKKKPCSAHGPECAVLVSPCLFDFFATNAPGLPLAVLEMNQQPLSVYGGIANHGDTTVGIFKRLLQIFHLQPCINNKFLPRRLGRKLSQRPAGMHEPF